MYKNVIIGLLAISTAAFMYLAVRNATPLTCSSVLNVDNSQVCIVNRQGAKTPEIPRVVAELSIEHYKY